MAKKDPRCEITKAHTVEDRPEKKPWRATAYDAGDNVIGWAWVESKEAGEAWYQAFLKDPNQFGDPNPVELPELALG